MAGTFEPLEAPAKLMYPDDWKEYYESRPDLEARRAALAAALPYDVPQMPEADLAEAERVRMDELQRGESAQSLRDQTRGRYRPAAGARESVVEGYPPAHWGFEAMPDHDPNVSALDEEPVEETPLDLTPGERVSDDQEVRNLVAQEAPPVITDPLGTEQQEYVEQNPTEESVLQGAIDLEADKTDFLASRALEEMDKADVALLNANKARETRDANIKVRIEALHVDAEKAANAKVDPERWWNNASTGQRVASILAAAIGGWLSPLQGGKNSALDAIDKAIERDIEAQMADLQNMRYGLTERRGIISDLAQQSKDAYRAAEATWQAAYQTMDKRLAIEQANYDPKGTRFQAIQAMRLGIVQRAQARAGAYADKVAQDEFKRAEFELKRYEAETARIKATKGLGGGKAGIGKATEEQKRAVSFITDAKTGQQLYAPTPELAAKLNDINAESDRAWDLYQDLLEQSKNVSAVEKFDFKVWKDKNAMLVDQTFAELLNIYKSAGFANAGASLTDTELMIIKQQIGQANSLKDYTAAWRQGQRRLIDKVEKKAQYITGNQNARWSRTGRKTDALSTWQESGTVKPEDVEHESKLRGVAAEEEALHRRQAEIDEEARKLGAD